MTTNNVYGVWHDERRHATFTTRAAAEAFYSTHLADKTDVWISETPIFDTPAEEIKPPVEIYSITSASPAEVDLLNKVFGQAENKYDPYEERAVKRTISYYESLPLYQGMEIDTIAALSEGDALLTASSPEEGLSFTVVGKTREAVEVKFLHELDKRNIAR